MFVCIVISVILTAIMLSSLRTKNINCEQEAKFIQDRIVFTEKHLAELCHAFAEYSRKAARVRDKGDEIVRVSISLSESENINKSLSDGLANFASSLTTISDYGDMRVKNIDVKVVHEFAQYENICKNVKDEVKQIYSARDREMLRKRQLDRIRERNPRNRQQITQAETELVKAKAEVSRTVHSLEEQITAFERQKLHDIKAILLDFIANEMGFHAKAIELLTTAYQDIDAINEDSDLQEFKKSLKTPTSALNAGSKSRIFRASHSLGSITTLFTAAQQKRSPVANRKPALRTSKEHGLSKSEETLDSLKRNFSNSDETESEEDADDEEIYSENATDSEQKSPPVNNRRYRK